MGKKRRIYDSGLAPRGVPSTLANLAQRTHSRLGPVRHTGHIYFRMCTGEPVLFHAGGRIVMSKHRPHWEQAPGMLVPLDISHGVYYLQGHGKHQFAEFWRTKDEKSKQKSAQSSGKA